MKNEERGNGETRRLLRQELSRAFHIRLFRRICSSNAALAVSTLGQEGIITSESINVFFHVTPMKINSSLSE